MHTDIKNEIKILFQKKNYPLAEILLRECLKNNPNDYEAIYRLGEIAAYLNMPDRALIFFEDAMNIAPEWKAASNAYNFLLNQLSENKEGHGNNNTKKYILIKAWGHGFWSDVSHVLAQLLLAELTNRIPIIYWGKNSLYSEDGDANAFETFFLQPSSCNIDDLMNLSDDEIWPPKWNIDNLLENNINKWAGPYSRIAGIYLLGRPERVIVSDFYTSVYDIRPWIPKNNPLHGFSIDDLWVYLARKYLRPQMEIINIVDDFYDKHFFRKNVLALHVRGSDKFKEYTTTDLIDETNNQYAPILDKYLSEGRFEKIFLMTDDVHILKNYKQIYGDLIVTTDCERSDSTQGVHKLPIKNKHKLGIEIMVDVYLATRANAFIGSGLTNPSRFVSYLKEWPKDAITLIGQNTFHMPNPFLHKW